MKLLWHRAFRTAPVALAVALATVPTLPAAAAPQPANPTREQVYAALHADSVRADYVVLVDTSGSMADPGLYEGVKASLGRFLRGLAPTDYLALYTFADHTAVSYRGPARPDAVRSLPPASQLGGSTDVGTAIEAALTELERDGAAQVASVVLITDGKHEPPPDSRYPHVDGLSWRVLANRAKNLSTSLSAYAIPLRSGKSGADLLKTVFPRAIPLNPASIGQLGGYLDLSKNAARLAKAKAALSGDIGKGVAVEWPGPQRLDLAGGSATVPVRLVSRTAHVPLQVTGLALRGAGPASVSGLPDHVTLAPGQALTYQLTVRWQPSAGALHIRRTARLDETLTVAGNVSSPWTAALGDALPLNVAPQPANGTRQLSAAVPVGWPGTLPLLVAVVLLVLAAAIWLRYSSRHPQTAGVLSVRSVVPDEELAVVRLGPRTVPIGAPRLPGSGTVRGRRVPGGVELLISYSPDGSAERLATRGCEPGGSVIVGGVAFQHHTSAQQAAVS